MGLRLSTELSHMMAARGELHAAGHALLEKIAAGAETVSEGGDSPRAFPPAEVADGTDPIGNQ